MITRIVTIGLAIAASVLCYGLIWRHEAVMLDKYSTARGGRFRIVQTYRHHWVSPVRSHNLIVADRAGSNNYVRIGEFYRRIGMAPVEDNASQEELQQAAENLSRGLATVPGFME